MKKALHLSAVLIWIISSCLFIVSSCNQNTEKTANQKLKDLPNQFIVVLGIAQDAGYPQIGCNKECCNAFWQGKEKKKLVTCLVLVDNEAKQFWLFEATPDITTQLQNLQPFIAATPDYMPDGIFITHAHSGHYTGLMQFGREAMGARDVNVWAMPRMDSFLKNNGPWSQLVTLKNIQINKLNTDSSVTLNNAFKVTPLKVPHRDEYSETAGFIIESEKKKVLFIPDIDKWEKWNRNIVDEIANVDAALLDGTFYKNGELPGRDMKEVPHPFVEESMNLFTSLPDTVKSKITFIHFNHTNPLLKQSAEEKKEVKRKGFNVAEEGMIIDL